MRMPTARPQRRKEQPRAVPSKARQRRRRDRYRPNRNGGARQRLITLVYVAESGAANVPIDLFACHIG
jgi:hypothetical protein